MSTKEESVERNDLPLLLREIRPIRNWHEWLTRWQGAGGVQWMESLLHVGFTISLDQYDHMEEKYDAIDRYIFYFSIADGWWNEYHFNSLPEDKGKSYYFGQDKFGNATKIAPPGLRQHLARKAFNMLCQNLFKMELIDKFSRDKFVRNWHTEIISERLFPIIQNFFRAEGEFGDIRIRNLPHHELSHNEEHAVSFLLNLIKFIWKWKEPNFYSSSKSERQEREKIIKTTCNRVDAAKPWTIELLVYLNKLDLLEEWIFELDKPCLAKLKEIAFRNEISHYRHPVMKDRPVVTIDEACYLGSKTAWFLKRHELMIKQRKRFEEILKAEQALERANQKIKKLSPKKS